MTSLRAKLALLIVGAIVSVVGLATAVTLIVAAPPEPARAVPPTAEIVRALARWAVAVPAADLLPAGRIGLSDEPLAGELAERQTRDLRAALASLDDPLPVRVTHSAPGAPPSLMASVPLANGQWLILPLPDIPPRPNWRWLVGWVLLIVAGATAIALAISHRMLRPLALLENSIAAVGPDGVLPPLPESGPGEVRATAQALNRLSRQLKTAMESRMRLVAAAGHDLRTPMTRMRLRAEFLEDAAERAAWLKDLDELDRIADSAISLVREEATEEQPEALSLDRLVAELTRELSALGFKVTAARCEAVRIVAARLALTRALRNLLINAATHGGGATVSVAREKDQALVIIEDEGPGIPEDLLERAFEPFFRVDPARRQAVPGAGLGLAIAKEILDRHRGTILLRNRKPRGLTQEVRLPVTESPPP